MTYLSYVAIPEVNMETKIRRDHTQDKFNKAHKCLQFQVFLKLSFCLRGVTLINRSVISRA